MLFLPESKNGSQKELLEKEIVRQLKIMKDNKPDSKEYQNALNTYKELKEISHKEKKLKESRYSRVFDALVTGLLAGVTITADYWTPVTSKWGNSFMRRFRHDDDIF